MSERAVDRTPRRKPNFVKRLRCHPKITSAPEGLINFDGTNCFVSYGPNMRTQGEGVLNFCGRSIFRFSWLGVFFSKLFEIAFERLLVIE